jgi:UDP-glucose 4-epimerase
MLERVNSMETILVTGACGGIGSRLIPSLLDQGYKVIAVDNLYSGKWENLEPHPNLSCFTIDIVRVAELVEALAKEEFQICIHLAAISSLPECQVNPLRAIEVNLLGTISITELCANQANFQRMIFASTSAVYEGISNELLTEDLSVSPTLVYPQTKYFAEQYLLALSRSRRFPVVIARLFNVFGDRQNAYRQSPPLINYLVRELAAGQSPRMFGWDAPGRDYVSVETVVNYFSLFIQTEAANGRVLNICSGKTLTVRDIYYLVSSTLGVSIAPTIDEPRNLWSEYSQLREGNFPLSSMWVENETNKSSLGSTNALTSLFGLGLYSNVMEEIPRTVSAIVSHMANRTP